MFTCNNNLLRTVPASCTSPAYTAVLRVFAMGLKLLLLLSLVMIRLDSSWVLAACHCAQVMCLNRSMIDLKVLCQAGAGLCPLIQSMLSCGVPKLLVLCVLLVSAPEPSVCKPISW